MSLTKPTGAGAAGELVRMGPLAPTHPLVGRICGACSKPFAVGEVVTLVSLGPGDDPEARRRAREGLPYSSNVAPVHWPCATGEETA